jgi:tRNA pseudouridine55 synthase
MNGIIVLDKPPDMTSAQVVARVKRITKAKKVGHTGTLDPFATGVLVCCMNRATRLVQFLTHGTKRYDGKMRLGIQTDTQDFTGEVISRKPCSAVTDQDVERAFRRFEKVKQQSPPAYSAVKHRGVPLYRLARRGTFVKKPPRPISIHTFQVREIDLPDVRFEICCSAGTYVRTVCADVGEALGCGAHLTALRRMENGRFTLDEAISLDTLQKLADAGRILDHVIPMGVALRGMPGISADNALVDRIRHGDRLAQGEVAGVADKVCPWIKVTDSHGNLVAVMHSTKKHGVHPYACVFPALDA